MAKERRRKRAYLDDFKKTASGEYAYRGAEYHLEETKEGRKKLFVRLWCLLAAEGLCLLACGCVPAAGMEGSAWVLIPYAVSWIAFAFVCSSLYRMTRGGDPLREYVYEAAVLKFPFRLKMSGLCAAAVILGELVYLILHGFCGKVFFTLVFFLLEGMIFVASFGMNRLTDRMKWTKIIK